MNLLSLRVLDLVSLALLEALALWSTWWRRRSVASPPMRRIPVNGRACDRLGREPPVPEETLNESFRRSFREEFVL